MLQSVKDPKGNTTAFQYDALGRRTAKTNLAKKEINRYIYDGNVLLHEFSYGISEKPKVIADDIGRLSLDKEENTENLITWVFNEGTFVPQAKIVNGETFSIISDYLGTPILSFDDKGNKVWERELDIYGKVKKGDNSFVPFGWQGQLWDEDVQMYNNRFRMYDPDMGMYVSQDPIGLAGGMPNMYAYVADSNSWVDPFGLSGLNFLQELANDAHSTLGNGQGFSTTAVGVDANGNYFVSSSSPYVPRPIKNWADDMGVEVIQSKKPNVHAEESLIKANKGITEIEPNRKVCVDCEELMDSKKVKFETATSGKKSKARLPGGKFCK